jgi:hypothetical protein
VTENWSETGVTCETQPAVSGALSSVAQDGVNQWVSFDVTALVRDWLADPASNFGVELRQPDIVIAASGKPLASLYASSAWADAGLRPLLEISAIPEPSTAALLAGGLGLFGWVGRRRQQP